MRRSHRSQTVIAAVALGLLCGGSGAAAARPHSPGASESCVGELVQFMEWTPGFRRLIWPDTREPFVPDWRRASAERARSAVEFALGVCDLTLPDEARQDLRARYEFRALSVQLREGLERWQQSPLGEFPEYSFAVTMMESRPDMVRAVPSIMIGAFGEFLREQGAHAIDNLDAKQSEALKDVLSHRFSEIDYLLAPGGNRARVITGHEGGHRLELRAWPHPSELVFVLFHELAHATPERAERFSRWKRDPSARSWVELGVLEEFRARALTAYFEAAWKRRYPQFGIAKEPVLSSIWEGLRTRVLLAASEPERARAYAEFYENWDRLSPLERETRLMEWVE